MRKIALALGLLLAHKGLGSAVYPPTHQEELRAVALASKSSEHSLLRHTWKRHDDFHTANQREINHIISKITTTNQTAEALKAAVKAGLESDLAAVQAFTATFKDLPKPTDKDSKEEKERKMVLAQFTAHKLVEGLTGALTLAQDLEAMQKLKNGFLPTGYEIALGEDKMVFTAGRESIFGNEQGRAFKTFLVRTLLAVMGKSSMLDLEEVMGVLYPTTGWLRSSAMAHLIPIPYYADVDPIRGTPYLCTIEGRHYLGHPNSAYEFGGHRQEYALYPTPKYNGPQDCSSGIAELIGTAPHLMRASTFHYYWAYQLMQGNKALVDAGIKKAGSTHAVEDVILGELRTLLQPVFIDDLRGEHAKIQPGDVYMYRNFNLTMDPDRTFGAGGHGVVILGLLPPESAEGYPRIVGYEWNRAIVEKGLDGRGVVERIFLPPSDTHYPMFFRPTEEAHRRISSLLAGSMVTSGAGVSGAS